MAFYNNLLLFSFVIVCTLQIGTSIKCYTCTSFLSPNICSDPINRTSLRDNIKDCERDYICMKQKLPGVDQVQNSVHRGCVPRDYCKGVLGAASDYCSVCWYDLCNSSPNIKPTIFFLTIPLFYLIRMYLQ